MRIIKIEIYIMVLYVVLSNSWLVRLITLSLTATGGGGGRGRSLSVMQVSSVSSVFTLGNVPWSKSKLEIDDFWMVSGRDKTIR